MGRLRVHALSMSLDGFVAGPDQTVDQPLGRGGGALHEWVLATASWRATNGLAGGSTGVDDEVAARATVGIGATLMGRNMFGPVRGPWPDHAWRGWWGEQTPFGHPVVVLTHHPRPSFTTADGTEFHFVTEGPEAALALAFERAGGLDVGLGGGARTVRTYLAAGLVDELHLTVVPVLLGEGERLFDDELDAVAAGYRCTQWAPSAGVLHAVLTREE